MSTRKERLERRQKEQDAAKSADLRTIEDAVNHTRKKLAPMQRVLGFSMDDIRMISFQAGIGNAKFHARVDTTREAADGLLRRGYMLDIRHDGDAGADVFSLNVVLKNGMLALVTGDDAQDFCATIRAMHLHKPDDIEEMALTLSAMDQAMIDQFSLPVFGNSDQSEGGDQ